jgi:hypothetical protein
MSLVGNMIAQAFAGNPASINYTMFVSAFSMFTLFYLFPASWNLDWAIHPIIMIVVDALNAIFFFCCAIALAARLEAHSCTNRVCKSLGLYTACPLLIQPPSNTSLTIILPTAPAI